VANEDWRSGVIAGAVTPFDDGLRVDGRALVPYLHFLAESGVSAVVVNADTGEGQHLDQTERLEVLRIAVNEIGGRVAVLSGLIANFTQEAVEAAKQFEDNGAVGLQVFPPVAFLGYPLDPGLVVGYYEALAKGTALPLIAYRPPIGLGYGIDSEVIAQLARVQAVAGIKESSFNRDAYAQTARLLQHERHRVRLLSGADTFVLESFRIGADGAMLAIATIAPSRWVELFRLHRTGRDDEADKLLASLDPLVRVIFAHPFRDFRARLKEVLRRLDLIPSAIVRPPLRDLGPSERDNVNRALGRSGLLPDVTTH
jgi:4-hydroxy-tetrahydrodipicolinate synthase